MQDNLAFEEYNSLNYMHDEGNLNLDLHAHFEILNLINF